MGVKGQGIAERCGPMGTRTRWLLLAAFYGKIWNNAINLTQSGSTRP